VRGERVEVEKRRLVFLLRQIFQFLDSRIAPTAVDIVRIVREATDRARQSSAYRAPVVLGVSGLLMACSINSSTLVLKVDYVFRLPTETLLLLRALPFLAYTTSGAPNPFAVSNIAQTFSSGNAIVGVSLLRCCHHAR
jgi:hypothetical protein